MRKTQVDKESILARIMELLGTLNQDAFTGYVKINFNQGDVARVEKFEELLKKHRKKGGRKKNPK